MNNKVTPSLLGAMIGRSLIFAGLTIMTAVLLAACGGQPEQQVANNTPAPEPATSTATTAPTDTAKPTNTPAPTDTAVPTNTPAPTDTPIPTDTPTSMPTVDFNLAFRDDFDGGLAENGGWQWMNEDTERWAISDEGWLTIQAANPPFTNGIVNLLWRPLPTDQDVIIDTLVNAQPEANFQQAALYFFNEDMSYISILIGFCQPCLPDAGGYGIFGEAFHQEENLFSEPVWVPRQETDTQVYLHLEYSPEVAVVVGFYAYEPGEWQRLFLLRDVPPLTRTGIGAANLPATEDTPELLAAFDFFEVEIP